MTSALWIGHLSCAWGYLGRMASQTTSCFMKNYFYSSSYSSELCNIWAIINNHSAGLASLLFFKYMAWLLAFRVLITMFLPHCMCSVFPTNRSLKVTLILLYKLPATQNGAALCSIWFSNTFPCFSGADTMLSLSSPSLFLGTQGDYLQLPCG